jgi:hypothetical protein
MTRETETVSRAVGWILLAIGGVTVLYWLFRGVAFLFCRCE